MDESLFHTLVVPTCQGVLAGLAVGFVVFRLIESIGRLTGAHVPTSRGRTPRVD